jgi:hypothetical protein
MPRETLYESVLSCRVTEQIRRDCAQTVSECSSKVSELQTLLTGNELSVCVQHTVR